MTINLDHDYVRHLISRQLEATDALDSAIGDLPPAPNGGLASSMIGFITSAVAESSGLAADATRGVMAIATDVVVDFGTSEDEAAEQFDDFAEELNEQ